MNKKIYFLLLLGLLCFAVIPTTAQGEDGGDGGDGEETVEEVTPPAEETPIDEETPQGEQELPVDEESTTPPPTEEFNEEEVVIIGEEEAPIEVIERETGQTEQPPIDQPPTEENVEEAPVDTIVDLSSGVVTASGLALISFAALQMVM